MVKKQYIRPESLLYSRLGALMGGKNLRELSEFLDIPYPAVRHIDAGSKKHSRVASRLLNFLITLLTTIPEWERLDYLAEIQRNANSNPDIPGGTPE